MYLERGNHATKQLDLTSREIFELYFYTEYIK
jgi:hypothetical protein